jgi:hypothetical protein
MEWIFFSPSRVARLFILPMPDTELIATVKFNLVQAQKSNLAPTQRSNADTIALYKDPLTQAIQQCYSIHISVSLIKIIQLDLKKCMTCL